MNWNWLRKVRKVLELIVVIIRITDKEDALEPTEVPKPAKTP